MKTRRYYNLPENTLHNTKFDWVHVYAGNEVPPTHDGSFNFLIWEIIQRHYPNHLLLTKYYKESADLAVNSNSAIIHIEYSRKKQLAKWLRNILAENPGRLARDKNFIDEAIKCISETNVENIIVWGDMEALPYLRWAFPNKSITFAQRYYAAKKSQSKMYDYCDYLLTQTKGTNQSLFEKELEISPTIITIPNGVDLDKYHPISAIDKKSLKKKFDIPEDKFVILFPSHLKTYRGTSYLNDWIRESRNLIPNAYYVVTGKQMGEPRGHKIELLKTLGVSDNCRWLKGISHDEMVEWYQVSDVALLPSLWPEGMSMASIEAMASGIPVIATNHGAFKDYISHLYNGWLCSTENLLEDGLKAIQTLATDQTLREKISANALFYARSKLPRNRSLTNFDHFFDKKFLNIDNDLSVPK